MNRHPARLATWLAGAAVALGSVVLAVTVPASWWGATFVAGVTLLMVGLRREVPVSYGRYWTRSTVLVVGGAVCAGGCYAFTAPPWGPMPRVAWPLGAVLFLGLFATCADAIPSAVFGRGAIFVGKMSRGRPPPYR